MVEPKIKIKNKKTLEREKKRKQLYVSFKSVKAFFFG